MEDFTKLKKHESPRSGPRRNSKGRGGVARKRQIQKKFKQLSQNLKKS